MDLFQWIAKYERKTGEKFERDERFELFFLPEKGFCEIGQLKDMLVANQCCGDLLFWRDKINSAARKAGGNAPAGTAGAGPAPAGRAPAYRMRGRVPYRRPPDPRGHGCL